MKNKLSMALTLALVLAMVVTSLALASGVDVAIVDVSIPIDAVTLAAGGSGNITINMTVTGNQVGTATFEVYRDWVLSGGTFTGSNPQEFTVLPRAAQDPATTFSTSGTVTVVGTQTAGTFTLAASAFDITNTNSTGAKLSDGADSDYDVTVSAPVVQNQTINVTQAAPGTAVYGSTFNVAATGGSSGNPVVITTSGSCSGGGNGSALMTMTSGIGTCTIYYNQAASAGYNAAPQVTSNTAAQKADANVSVSGYTGAYDGASHGATGSATGVGGANLNAFLNLGATFTDVPGGTANWSFTGGDNYINENGSVSIQITQAPVIAAAGGGTSTYDGSAKSPSACVVSGAYTVGLSCANNPASVGPDAGTYAISPVVSGTGQSNFAITLTNGSYIIEKADALCTVNGYTDTYDGDPHGATGSCTGVGGVDLSASLNLGATFTDYPGGTAYWTFTGGTNYIDQNGNVAITINKAPVTATAGGGMSTYDGSAKSPSACLVSGAYTGNLTCANDPASVGPDAGTYAISPVVSGTGLTNFEITSVADSYEIEKAPVTATAGSGSGTYNGFAQAPSACAVTGAYTGDLTCANNPASVGPNAGTTTIVPVVSGTGLTNFAVTSVNGSYTINKANATCIVTGYSVYYDGLAHTATGSCTGVLGENLADLNLTGTTHTLVGAWSDSWTFTDITGNYNNTSGSVSDAILAWTLKGFYQPVDMNGVWNTVKGGSTVPFKFEIFAGSTELKLTSYVAGFSADPVACPTTGVLADDIEVLATGGTSLRFDTTGDQFIFNWQTPKKPGACYNITMTTLDGSSLSALFRLK